MTELQRIGCILIALAIVYAAAQIADRRERARRKAAHRRRVRDTCRYKARFTINMRDSDSMWDKPELPAKGETIFHSKDCADFCGGKYLPKGETI